MRLVFAGTPAVALPTLDAVAASGHELAAVVTRPDAARGRSRRPVPSEVARWADARGVRVLKPEHPRDPGFIAALADIAPDACPVVAYGALIPLRALDVPRYGWINLHFSLLPRWRGAAPVQRAIMAGDRETGATTFRLVPELDAGPVFGTLRRDLDGSETAGELLAALAADGARLMMTTLDALATSVPTPQDAAGVTLAPKITVAEAELDWTRPAEELDRLIRGCSPAPMAWTELDGVRVRIAYARPTGETGLAPGALRVEKRRVLAGTGTTALELVRVHPHGRTQMPAADWGRGLREPAARFGDR